MKDPKYSALYRYIQRLHGERPWGSVLDAGTGTNSLRWVSGLSTTRWTAVTGSSGEAQLARQAIGDMQRPQDKIVLGNWADDQLLNGDAYDTVLADYLLGAVEGFAPYFQPYLFPRLRPLTQKTLYVTGLEPYVPIDRPDTAAGRIVWEIGRFRDACMLLKGGMPYREYPAQWVVDHVKRAGFLAYDVKHFKIGYKGSFVNAQLKIALHGINELGNPTMAKVLNDRSEALRQEAHEMIATEGALRFCRNYVIAAKPV